MRRRIRSAAFPLHRHSLPQLVVDGALVALAYFLAFQLRFDNGVKGAYQVLVERTWWWAVVISLVIFTLFRLYQRWWRYAGQRDYETIARAVFVATLALVGAVAVLHPVVRQVGLHTVVVHT
ncbi:MAG TPA: polysaccharide biosynthesis protein, partial [Solirubrobacteraceae bacterium]|nr:polysaccharide biosynthesis protein [Solirubrobacteraceae bacterium]